MLLTLVSTIKDVTDFGIDYKKMLLTLVSTIKDVTDFGIDYKRCY